MDSIYSTMLECQAVVTDFDILLEPKSPRCGLPAEHDTARAQYLAKEAVHHVAKLAKSGLFFLLSCRAPTKALDIEPMLNTFAGKSFKAQIFQVIAFSLLVASAGSNSAVAANDDREILTSSSGPQHYNFKQALEKTLERNPDFAVLKLTASNSRLGARSAWAALLPTVDFTATHQYENHGGTVYTLGPQPHFPWSTSAALNVVENLYDNGETFRSGEIASLQQQIDNSKLDRGRNNALFMTASAYYDFSEATSTMKLQNEQLAVLRQQFKSIEIRYHQGISSNRDYLRIKAQLQRSEVEALNQTYRVQEARQALTLAIGVAGDTEFDPYDPITIDPATIQFPKVDLEQTSEYKIAHASEEITEYKYKSAVRADWPRLSLKGTFDYNQPQYLGDRNEFLDDPYWSAKGLAVLEFNILDWGTRRRAIEVATNNETIEKATQRKNLLLVAQRLTNLSTNGKVLIENYKISSQILKDAQAVYSSLNDGYRNGKVTYLELITSLTELYSSRTSDLTLRFNILKNRAELALYQGNADEVLNNQ